MKQQKLNTLFFALLSMAWFNQSQAQVNTCDALRMYGAAVTSGLCKSLSPGNQHLWVCDLTGGAPDIHTTFNAATNLHVTVRHNPAPPNCQGNSYLSGVWPAGLGIQAGQPAFVCQVSIQGYVDRLNAVAAIPAMPGQSLCRSAFLAAQHAGKLTAAQTHLYLANCGTNACP